MIDWDNLSKIKEIAVPLWLVIIVIVMALRGIFK
jgi:hypothetical protein